MPLCLLSRNLPWPQTPLQEIAHQYSETSGLASLSLHSLGPLGLLRMLSAFPPLSLSLLHLTTWKVLFHLAKSCSSFKAFLNASGSKSFADISATQGLLPVTSELIHISLPEPTFLKSPFVIILCVRMHVHVSVCMCVSVCSCMCRHVYVFMLLCVHAHICAGICMCMQRSEDNSNVIFINTIFL